MENNNMDTFMEALEEVLEEIWHWIKVPFVLIFFLVLTMLLPFILKKPDDKEKPDGKNNKKRN